MAEPGEQDLMSSQPESNNYHPEEQFETIDATNADQDERITSTSIAGEEKAEEDLYAAGASEAEHIPSSDPLISFGDEPEIEPSAPVAPEPLLNFDPMGSGPDSTNPPTKYTPDPVPPPSEPFEIPKTEPISLSEAKEEPKSEGSWMKNIDPRVLDLIYWRDVRKTGVVFGSMLFVLLSLAFFSVLSVVAYLSLAILTVTLSFRIYKNILIAVQKSNEGHPFKTLLDMDIELPEDKVQKIVQNVLKHMNCTAKELRRLFLIEDLVDSIKFGLLLWVLTYVGSWFNGMTLIILAVVMVFTAPKVYETYKVQIDNYLGLAKEQIDKVMAQVQAKLPFFKKKTKTQ